MGAHGGYPVFQVPNLNLWGSVIVGRSRFIDSIYCMIGIPMGQPVGTHARPRLMNSMCTHIREGHRVELTGWVKSTVDGMHRSYKMGRLHRQLRIWASWLLLFFAVFLVSGKPEIQTSLYIISTCCLCYWLFITNLSISSTVPLLF